MLFINAQILTMSGSAIENGYLLARDGKIISLGPMRHLPTRDGQEVIDLNGKLLLPGFVDAHSHLGLSEEGVGAEGEDLNETSDPATPHIRAIDGLNPIDRSLPEAWAGGVTCIVTSPGSANTIGGQICAFKPVGRRIDNAILKEPLAMKFALGENPKTAHGANKKAPYTRMAEAAIIRESLMKASCYLDTKRTTANDETHPTFDFKSEALIPVLERKIRAHFHAHRASDILTAIRISKEFNLDYVLVHCTEGHLIADILAEENPHIICGPVIVSRTKPELSNLEIANAVTLTGKGLKPAICTDHPVIPAHYLATSAAIVAAEGLNDEQALQSITLWAAIAAGLDDRVGSLEPGKDADLLVYDEHPLHTYRKPSMVFIDGERLV